MTCPDAMVSFGADDEDEWDEVLWCAGCLQDRLLSMTIGDGGRLLGMCEHCWQRSDFG